MIFREREEGFLGREEGQTCLDQILPSWIELMLQNEQLEKCMAIEWEEKEREKDE